MRNLRFDDLMSASPTLLHSFKNAMGQLVSLYEHPTLGDSYPIIIVIGRVAVKSDFYEVDDLSSGGEYEPLLIENKIVLTYETHIEELP